MTYAKLIEIVADYFADTSRPASETRRDMLALADECRYMADTIPEQEMEGE